MDDLVKKTRDLGVKFSDTLDEIIGNFGILEKLVEKEGKVQQNVFMPDMCVIFRLKTKNVMLGNNSFTGFHYENTDNTSSIKFGIKYKINFPKSIPINSVLLLFRSKYLFVENFFENKFINSLNDILNSLDSLEKLTNEKGVLFGRIKEALVVIRSEFLNVVFGKHLTSTFEYYDRGMSGSTISVGGYSSSVDIPVHIDPKNLIILSKTRCLDVYDF